MLIYWYQGFFIGNTMARVTPSFFYCLKPEKNKSKQILLLRFPKKNFKVSSLEIITAHR